MLHHLSTSLHHPSTALHHPSRALDPTSVPSTDPSIAPAPQFSHKCLSRLPTGAQQHPHYPNTELLQPSIADYNLQPPLQNHYHLPTTAPSTTKYQLLLGNPNASVVLLSPPSTAQYTNLLCAQYYLRYSPRPSTQQYHPLLPPPHTPCPAPQHQMQCSPRGSGHYKVGVSSIPYRAHTGARICPKASVYLGVSLAAAGDTDSALVIPVFPMYNYLQPSAATRVPQRVVDGLGATVTKHQQLLEVLHQHGSFSFPYPSKDLGVKTRYCLNTSVLP